MTPSIRHRTHSLVNGPLLLAMLLATLLAWAVWAPMRPLFNAPLSTVLLDRHGELLAASVSADGQWRMPPGSPVPQRFITCLLEFEDRHFHRHPGVHVPSLVRAWQQNRRAGRTVSGGSTITMQVARMCRPSGDRTLARKLMEMLLALRLELRHSKEEILAMYTDNAPFGGNVVGLEAAAWRWFGRAPGTLGWAECATLAVLPNAPSRIHPGRNREELRAKRDRLLDRLHRSGAIDTLEWELARAEPLPGEPHPLPQLAPHLLGTLRSQGHEGRRIRSTIDADLQRAAMLTATRHAQALNANEVHNAAILVLDLPSGAVLAYVGNLPSAGTAHAGSVDIVQARRSTGSLLKPFLYASMIDAGELMPDQLVADIPTYIDGFVPRNFDRGHSGAVPASQALARSLNVPAVRALQDHGVLRTLHLIRAMGLHHVDRTADDYGLSLVVGGAESTLWELTGAYASLGRILLLGPDAHAATVHAPLAIAPMEGTRATGSGPPPLSAAAAHHTVVALRSLERPEAEAGWQRFSGGIPIAWKTGTSFGHRDAWAIGITDRYAVGVWTGNASGEGRPGLTGALAAAPILFELFDMLPNCHGFEPPYDLMERMAICRASGYRAGMDCGPVDTLWTAANALRTPTCPHHRRIMVNADASMQVGPGEDGHMVTWFVLPPVMAHYHTAVNPAYRPLPPQAKDRGGASPGDLLEAIYPAPGARILVPQLMDGVHGRVVLQAAHSDPHATIHWDLDGDHLGSTKVDHRLAVDLVMGSHRLTLTDGSGYSISTAFHVERSAAR